MRALPLFLFILSAFVFFTARSNAASLIFALVVLLLARAVKKSKINPAAAVIGFLALCAIIIGVMLIASESSTLGGNKFSARFAWVKNTFALGEIVDGNQITYEVVGEPTWGDVIKIILLRCVCYFSIWLPLHSTIHKLVNFVLITPVWILSAISIYFAVREKKKEYLPVLFGAFCYWIFQVLTSIDFDMRYRAPIFAPLVILSSYSVKRGLDALDKQRKRERA